ncbi:MULTISPECIES: hypothetical protein [unclassified Arthrobacter]|uniref:hypothetical protein n=1 Tax=unclassified Arthrobacter TaxID=235627 RepID=UPI002E069317|nr:MULTISPECIES: hypothetical protein [unclassified Arthrobacter]MEC5191712.1 acetylornithine deacetylase/succinyl-diaminopimelate desuccinylase-like protein [Arthrobacter sp. MP_M4]MEC5203402.1 acetylornithine deacetylase/succinyl-diaminopimelate desuccinylase-like protein [Arthrobacter sp. MP_M7]
MPTTPAPSVARAAAALAELVQFRTVSSRLERGADPAEFEGFIAALARLYPGVHATLELERVNGHALLFRWPGTGADPAARPAVLMAHYDVVPAGDPDAWTRPPFSGHNDGTYLWGRGNPRRQGPAGCHPGGRRNPARGRVRPCPRPLFLVRRQRGDGR